MSCVVPRVRWLHAFVDFHTFAHTFSKEEEGGTSSGPDLVQGFPASLFRLRVGIRFSRVLGRRRAC